MTAPSTVLFLDWLHVHSGNLKPTLDASRLSAHGRKVLDRYAQEFNIHFDQTGHGLHRQRLPFGVKVTVEKARKSEPWLVADRPWESSLAYVTVLRDQDRFRCWYACFPPQDQELVFADGRAMEKDYIPLLYAESTDGFHWEKPALTSCPTAEHKTNNIVYENGGASAVFRDDGGPPEERYKCFAFDLLRDVPETANPAQRYGLYGAVSPDGYRWKTLPEPLIRYFCDTQNVGYWDPEAGEYVGYFRSHLRGRAIARAATRDFRHWPMPVTILHPGAEDGPFDDYYTNGFTSYPDLPGVKLMFPSIFHHNDNHVDVRLAVTHNGLAVNWVSREPIIEVGRSGEWDCGSIYPGPNLVRLPDGRLALPYFGTTITHEESSFHMFYGDYPPARKHAFAWALWDDGRLAGIEAADYGEFYTEPVLVDADRIEINARTTRSGKVEVALCEEHADRYFDGFSFAQAVPFNGDELWSACRWRDKQDVSELKGKRIRLHFRLGSAKVFGYRLI